jgi:hypothetical protein
VLRTASPLFTVVLLLPLIRALPPRTQAHTELCLELDDDYIGDGRRGLAKSTSHLRGGIQTAIEHDHAA